MREISVIVATEDATGRPIQPKGFLTVSVHTTEAKALEAAQRCNRATSILRCTTATNRPRFRVLAPYK